MKKTFNRFVTIIFCIICIGACCYARHAAHQKVLYFQNRQMGTLEKMLDNNLEFWYDTVTGGTLTGTSAEAYEGGRPTISPRIK